MNGFLNINKPKNITSYDVIRILKKKLSLKRGYKIGHGGNLDPIATGVLVVGIGKATKFLPFITDMPKEYVATIKFGVLTNTLDISGQVIDEKEVPLLKEEDLKNILKRFTGKIKQIPPSFSAVKYRGRKLYEFAREGVHIKLQPKEVTVYDIELLDFLRDKIKIRVKCSKGTYIRALARDIGEEIGTYGIVEDIIRTKVGNFDISDSISPEVESLENFLIPIDKAFLNFPEVRLRNMASWYFQNGNKVKVSDFLSIPLNLKNFDYVRVYDENGKFIGLGFFKWNILYPKKVVVD